MIIDFHTHMFPDRIAESTIRFLADTCRTSRIQTELMMDCLLLPGRPK